MEGGVVGFFFGRTPIVRLGEEGRVLGNVTLLDGTVILRTNFLPPIGKEKISTTYHCNQVTITWLIKKYELFYYFLLSM